MSIASEITRISGNVADAYTAANAKGATMPITQNSDNLATTIATIPTGTTPTGTKSITANGVYDVADYANADVQVPTTAPESYRAFQKGANGTLVNSTSNPWVPLPAGTTNIGEYLFYFAYSGTPANVLSGSIDLSSLTMLSGSNACNNMFSGCSGITSVDLSSLTTISGNNACNNMFGYCSGITNVDLRSLTTVSGNTSCSYMFTGCTRITNVDLSSLTKITANAYGLTSGACARMFINCAGITNFELSSLTTVTGGYACGAMFQGCTGLTSLLFPSLTSASFGSNTNQFNTMLSGVTGCTVHFPSNIQSVVGSWSDVTNGFGGTNTTVLFDLPATNTLTGADTVTYTRNPKYDTATALAWKTGAYGTTNFTPAYYTSGTTEPTVGGTIYSDAACTVAVTTIDSIA